MIDFTLKSSKDCDPNSSLAAKEVLIKTVEIENIPSRR
jgi:hypothetical protein